MIRGLKHKKNWVTYYSFGAIIAILALFTFMRIYDRSLIWSVDGLIEYLPTAQYAKTFWSSVIHGSPTMIDFTLGEGLDPIQCMTYYGLTEPFSLLYIIVPDSFVPTMFGCITALKIFLSGLTFGWYAKKHSNHDKSVAIGALIYIFSGFFILWLQAPIFLNAGYLFPLLLNGMDKCFDEHKYTPLAFLTALAYIINYYMAMVMSFMLLIYSIIRLCTNGKFNKHKLISYGLTAVSHLSGILLSAIVLFPVLMGIGLSVRSGENSGYANSLLFYPITYYIDAIRASFTPVVNTIEYWQHPYQIQLNFSPIAAPAILMFLATKTEKGTKERILKIALSVCLLFAVVPFFGKLFNGYAYPTHRWAFALAFVMAMIVVWAVPRLAKMKLWIKVTSAGLFIIGCILNFFMTIPNAALAAAIIMAALTLIVLFNPKQAYLSVILSGVTFLLTTLIAYPYAATFNPSQINQLIESEMYSTVDLTNEEYDEFIRVATTDNTIGTNISSLKKMKTATGVWNILPTGTGDYIIEQQFPSAFSNFWAIGLDDRTVPTLLSGTRYFVTSSSYKKQSTQNVVPYGFELIYTKDVEYIQSSSTTKRTYYIYKNTCDLGIGYLYKKTFSAAEFKKLNIAEKQLALLEYAVVDGSDNIEHPNIDIEIEFAKSINNGKIYLTFQAPKNYEIYLSVEDVHYDYGSNKIPITDYHSQLEYQNSLMAGIDNRSVFVTATAENKVSITKEIAPQKENCHLTTSPSKSICLGHELYGLTTITFDYDIDVCFDGFAIYAVPLNAYDEGIQLLSNNQWTDVAYSTPGNGNFIEGQIDAQFNGVFQIAIPYTKGWTAYVDEKEVDIFASGIKYIGLNLTEGQHTVRLEYETPGIKVGTIISTVMLIVLIITSILESRYHKRKQKNTYFGPPESIIVAPKQ